VFIYLLETVNELFSEIVTVICVMKLTTGKKSEFPKPRIVQTSTLAFLGTALTFREIPYSNHRECMFMNSA
jgi:hypothetical protein